MSKENDETLDDNVIELIELLLDKFYSPYPSKVEKATEGLQLMSTSELYQTLHAVVGSGFGFADLANLLLSKGFELIESEGSILWRVYIK